MGMKIFEYAAVYQGKKDKDGSYITGQEPRILVGPTSGLFKDAATAQIAAARAIPQDVDLDKVEIAIRPF